MGCGIVPALVFFLFFGSAAAGLGQEYVDLGGRRVAVPDQVERIVALGPGCLRLVTYLKAVDLVVGVEEIELKPTPAFFRPYSQAISLKIKDLPVIGSGGPGKTPNFEALLSCRPQVIFAIGYDAGQIENLQSKTGIPVVVLSYGQLGVWREEAEQSLHLLAGILGREERARALSEFIARSRKELAARRDTGQRRQEVYFGGIAYKGGRGFESTEAGYFPGHLAGADNVAGNQSEGGHLFLSRERLLQLNPEIIFLDYSSCPQVVRQYLDNPAFFDLFRAVREKRLFTVLPYNQYNTNLESALANAFYISSQLQPESCSPTATKERIEEIFAFFLDRKISAAEIPAYRPARLDRLACR